jgi:tetratricopeptide (TPR) repeat protein
MNPGNAFGTPASAFRVDALIDSEIRKGSPKILIEGYRRSGLTETSKRLLAKGTQGYLVIDLDLDSTPDAIAEVLEKASSSINPVALFVHDYWGRVEIDKLQDWIPDRPKRKAIQSFIGNFRSESRRIRHTLELDASQVVNEALAEAGINLELTHPLQKVLRSRATIQVGDSEVFLPGVPAQALEMLDAATHSHIQRIKRWEVETDSNEIRELFDDWQGRALAALEGREVVLGVAGVGMLSASTTTVDFVKAVLTTLGGAALPADLSDFLSLPNIGGFLLGSALASLFLRRGKKEGVTEYEEYREEIPKAAKYWNLVLTDDEKLAISYELDCAAPLPPGTSYEILEARFHDPSSLNVDAIAEALAPQFDGVSEDCRRNLEKELDKVHIALISVLRDIQQRVSRMEAEVSSLKKGIRDGFQRIKEEAEKHPPENPIPRQPAKKLDLVELNTNLLPQVSIRQATLVRSSRLSDKVELAVKEIINNRKVVIVGAPGMGKSVLLYLVCRKLIATGTPTYYGGIDEIPFAGVYVQDNLTPSSPGYEAIRNLSRPVVVTARTTDWKSSQDPEWMEISMEPPDFGLEICRRILTRALRTEAVRYSEEGIQAAIRKCQRHPIYLVELARWLRLGNRQLDENSVKEAPADVRRLMLDELRLTSVSPEDRRLVVQLLYCLALTSRHRLHQFHLQSITKSLGYAVGRWLPREIPPVFYSFVDQFPSSVFSLTHDLWVEVLLGFRSAAGEEFADVGGNQKLRDFLSQAFEQSVPKAFDMRPDEAANLMLVSMENQRFLSPRYLSETEHHGQHPETAMHISEVVAHGDPTAVGEYLESKVDKENTSLEDQLTKLRQVADGCEEHAPAFSALVLRKAEIVVRELVGAGEERFFPDLAKIMKDLGNTLQAQGEHWEAISCYQECEGIYRELGRMGKEQYRSDLATVLNSLGKVLLDQGRLEEALASCNESEGIYRELLRVEADRIRPELSNVLNNLGNILSEQGKLDEALTRYRECETIRRDLVGGGEERYRPDLATALGGIGAVLRAQGKLDGAIACYRECQTILRELVGSGEERYRPALATALNDAGDVLSDQDKLEEAAESCRESEGIYRQLIGTGEERYRPDLAKVLNNLGSTLSNQGKLHEAVARYRECERIRRELVGRGEERFLPDLATVLNNLGAALSDQGKLNEAIACGRESEGIYRELILGGEDRFHLDLAAVMNNLGAALSDQGKLDESIACYLESEGIYRELVDRGEEQFHPDLATVMVNLGNVLSDQGKLEEAIASCRESEGIYRELVGKGEDRYRTDLAMVLNNLGASLLAQGKLDDTIACYRECDVVYRELVEHGEERFLPDLAMVLNNLGVALRYRGRLDEAIASYRECEKIRRKLVEKGEEQFRPDLAKVLINLSVALKYQGKLEEAEACSNEVEHLVGRAKHDNE